jgi:catalase
MALSYFNNNAETYSSVLFLLSDFGTPVSFRYTDIYSVNTYKFTKTVSNAESKLYID